MGNIIYDEKKFIYESEAGRQTLLDLRRTLDNKSNIPIIEVEGREVTVLTLIDRLQQFHPQIDAEAEKNQLGYVLMDFLLCRLLMRSTRPLRVAEFGCTQGIMSFHLAYLMGQYNRKSLLCGICDSIGNESGNQWLDRVSLVQEPPELALSVMDYDEKLIQEKSFDLVIINGREQFREPQAVVENAFRVLKDAGAVLCYEKEQPILTEALFDGTEEPEIFPVDNEVRVSCLEHGFFQEQFHEEPGEEEYLRTVNAAERLLIEGADKSRMREGYRRVDACLERVMRQEHTDWKLRLIELEEEILDAMYPAK